MKLLIVTQVVDVEDPILGFFVSWIRTLSKHFERIEVICLKKGTFSLPENVYVHSLGKESGGHSKFVTAIRFKTLAFKLRKNYDTVFVHMNPEYIITAGLLWRLLGKKITFWYNHPKRNIRLLLASFFAHKIFYTSPYAATAKSKKSKRMPVGIDTELFKAQQVAKSRKTIYLQGRVTPSKRIHVALEALRILRLRIPATLTVVGPEDSIYGKELRKQFADVCAEGAVVFLGPKQNSETPRLYATHGVSLNLAGAGHYDKAVFESMACETPVIVGSTGYEDVISSEWIVPQDDAQALATAIEKLLLLKDAGYAVLGEEERSKVVQFHSLEHLSAQIQKEVYSV